MIISNTVKLDISVCKWPNDQKNASEAKRQLQAKFSHAYKCVDANTTQTVVLRCVFSASVSCLVESDGGWGEQEHAVPFTSSSNTYSLVLYVRCQVTSALLQGSNTSNHHLIFSTAKKNFLKSLWYELESCSKWQKTTYLHPCWGSSGGH